jgi:4-hydroxybenzoate polyprenyltransferase
MQDVYEMIIFSSIFMGLTGMAMVSTSFIIQGIPLSMSPLLIMFLVPFSIYNLNRGTDEKEDSVNRSDRYAFTKRFGKILFRAAVLAYLVAMILAVYLGTPVLVLVSIPLVLGLLYSLRLLPPSFPYRRLKEIPLMKNLVVGFSWAILTAFLPVFATSTPDLLRGFICLVFFFSYVFIGSIIPDIRDREGDSLAGIKTIPVLIGPERSGSLLTGTNLAVGIVVTFASLGRFPLPIVLLLTCGFLYTQCCIHLFMSVRTKNFVSDFLFDGQYIIFAIILVILSMLRI